MSDRPATPATAAGRVLLDVTFRGEDGSFDLLDPIPPANYAAIVTAILAIETDARELALADVRRAVERIDYRGNRSAEIEDVLRILDRLSSQEPT